MADKKITDLQLRSAVESGLNFPSDDGIQSYRVTADQIYSYIRGLIKPEHYEISNLQITFAVGSSAATIALKTNAAVDASSTDPIRVGFRSSTLTSGVFVIRSITSALSVVLSSGSTLGQVSGQPSTIFVYLIDASGTPELAVSHKKFAEDALVSTTAEGGAGAADSATVMYSTTARTNVACRLVGQILNTQSTAGTWAATATQIQLLPVQSPRYPTVTRLTSGSGTYNTPAGATKLRITMRGAGGGGGGSQDTVGSHSGASASATTFGSSLLSAGGGTGGAGGGAAASGGAGGTPTVNSPAVVIDQQGGGYGGAGGQNSSIASVMGGHGGVCPGGSMGATTIAASVPTAAPANSGGGGAGAPGTASPCYPGLGGGAGAFLSAWIFGPLASYAYSVEASAAGGSNGTNGLGGGASGSGVIIIEEFYD